MLAIDLGGQWRVAQAGEGKSIPAWVPGCVHTDLLAAGKIEDPFFRDRESEVQWIGEVDWVYTREFTVPAATLDHDRVLLRCEGLDTLAVVTVNDVEVARTDNMFRTWEFDVKDVLRAGVNTLAIRFLATIPYIAERQAQQPISCWSGAKEVKGRAWVRKEPCNFGWDWGPTLVTCGIWRPIAIVAFNTARLVGAHIRQDHTTTPGTVTLHVTAQSEETGEAPLNCRIVAALAGNTVAETHATVMDGRTEATLTLTDPQLWWPNGMGAHPLYDVTVELCDAAGQCLNTLTKRIGLRTLRLDRHADEWGESFQFVVNGVPFFAKGGNWIPADAFANRVTLDHYRDLLLSVVDANMNMLRVWGGGIYEQEMFYNLCDEWGICVWQDFMFACSTYPSYDDAFMANVKAEAIDNVSRLRHHACIALWCGNNELEQGLVGENPGWQMSWEHYSRLFDTLLPEVVATFDPERDYWPCSPHSPQGDRADHSNPQWGDAHLWDVWHGKKPFEWYRTCEHRFASEFGFQSFPEPKAVHGYTLPADRNITSFVMEHHQRSGIGNTTIISYMLDWYRLPTDFDMTLWLSQILHGMAIKYAVENWRRHMPRTMGTIYWQLNDCWPVASWASIDYHGRWKALQFMAKKFFAPLLISGVEDPQTGAMELHVTSDLLEPKSGNITWLLTDVGGKTLASGSVAAEIAPGRNTHVDTLQLGEYLQTHGARNLLLWIDLSVDGQAVSDNFVTFSRPKHLELVDPEIVTEVKPAGGNAFRVTLTAQSPALWAWLELDGAEARCSDNFVHLRPGKPVTIILTPAAPHTLDDVQDKLRIRSLVNTYRPARELAVR